MKQNIYILLSNKKAAEFLTKEGYKLTKGTKVTRHELSYGNYTTHKREVYFVDGFTSARAFSKYLRDNDLLLRKKRK